MKHGKFATLLTFPHWSQKTITHHWLTLFTIISQLRYRTNWFLGLGELLHAQDYSGEIFGTHVTVHHCEMSYFLANVCAYSLCESRYFSAHQCCGHLTDGTTSIDQYHMTV